MSQVRVHSILWGIQAKKPGLIILDSLSSHPLHQILQYILWGLYSMRSINLWRLTSKTILLTLLQGYYPITFITSSPTSLVHLGTTVPLASSSFFKYAKPVSVSERLHLWVLLLGTVVPQMSTWLSAHTSPGLFSNVFYSRNPSLATPFKTIYSPDVSSSSDCFTWFSVEMITSNILYIFLLVFYIVFLYH